jgi:hypothetical protein
MREAVVNTMSLKAGAVTAATFSPDGRLVACEVAASVADPTSRIFVLPAEGGEPQLIYEERRATGFSQVLHPLRLLDWTADGRYLAIGSERTGKGALHLLPIRDGKSAGAPVFIRYGDFEATGSCVPFRSALQGGYIPRRTRRVWDRAGCVTGRAGCGQVGREGAASGNRFEVLDAAQEWLGLPDILVNNVPAFRVQHRPRC